MSADASPPAPTAGAQPSEEEICDQLRARVAKQKALVRQLKKDGGDFGPAVVELTALKKQLAEMAGSDVGQTFNVDRERLDGVLKKRMFVVPSFEIYGGAKGFYDFGPPGCALKANLLALWRKHFVLEESMLEIECTNLMTHSVLSTSGHVERFTDLMVKDPANDPPCARADKLLEEHIEGLLLAEPDMPADRRKDLETQARMAEALNEEEMHAAFQKFGIVSPAGNPWSRPFPFNLMFKTTIGPEGTSVGYLRPETAQGIFINFERLRDFNAGKLPFAAAQIGQAYRNEIAPRSGLLRVREFCQAEIEHFVDPEVKKHDKFSSVSHLVIPLFDRKGQLETGKVTKDWTIQRAVAEGMIDNETLGYFMSRTFLFLTRAGVHADKIRFRQHLLTEMAHYAADCWDAEVLTSYGWVECVGHADRSCFDLEAHAKVTGRSMLATKIVKPHIVRFMKIALNKKVIGKTFKREAGNVVDCLSQLAVSSDEGGPEVSAAGKIEAELATNGKASISDCNGSWEITREMVNWSVSEKTVQEVKYRPSVIEPSFGIGRILYALLEHSYAVREENSSAKEAAASTSGEEKVAVEDGANKKKKKKKKNEKKKKEETTVRNYFSFKPVIAPIKCALLPLSNHSSLMGTIEELNKVITQYGVSVKIDGSGAQIGRKYARMDEVGIPFAVVVDFKTVGYETAKDGSVTLRERDSMQQIRISMQKLAPTLRDLVEEHTTWSELVSEYGLVGGASNETVLRPQLHGGGSSSESTKLKIEGNTNGSTGFSRPADM